MGRPPRKLKPHVSLRHFFGAELRHWREQAGLSHARLGAQVNYSSDLISKVEKAERTPTAALAKACDEVLGAGGVLERLVALIEATAEATPVPGSSGIVLPVVGCVLAVHGPTVGGSSARGADPVDRFEFLASVFGVGAGALVGSESAEVSRLGPEGVTAWRSNLARLRELDDQYGGSGVYELALRSLRRLRRVLHRGSYSPSTGEKLHTLAGELTEHTGWLAYDAGRQADARYWWLEASHTAQLANDNRMLVVVLQAMSQQASQLGRPREAVELAQAAQQAAKLCGSSRLQSLLLAREALGHARAGDERATWHALHRAGVLLGAGQREEDPPWLAFWSEADLASLVVRAAQDLGNLPLAERSARDALAAVGPAYPRNRALYLGQHVEVLVRLGHVEEAVYTATQAVEAASEVSSARIADRLDRVRAELAHFSNQPKVTEFLDWSAEVLRTKTNTTSRRI
ncbi:MAG: helix-turn-helix domain-containing protein [Pseudonocardiaceae bacterium]